MTISFEDSGSEKVIRLQGRLDALTSPPAQVEVERHLEANPGRVRLDCSGLSYISSAGLRVLLHAAKKNKAGLSLSGLNEAIRETIEISGLSTLFKIV